MPPITAMAFDFGSRSIGVAVGQTLTGSGQELPPIRARDGIPQWPDIEQLIQEWQPNHLLVGDPLNMDGSVSDFCLRARKFARRLAARYEIPVELIDERLSTFEAKEEAKLRGHKGNYRDEPIDSIAARILLESWLFER